MDWNILTAQNLAVIERKINQKSLTVAQKEIIKRVIYTNADFDYQSIITFVHDPLHSGVAALSARIPILVDSPVVQSGISPILQDSFLNPIYSLSDIALPGGLSTKKTKVWQTIARRNPSGIYIIGENFLLLLSLLDLIESKQIKPSLIIATPPGFIGKEMVNKRLRKCLISQIRIDSSKGGVNSAIAIFNSLVELAWVAKHQKLI